MLEAKAVCGHTCIAGGLFKDCYTIKSLVNTRLFESARRRRTSGGRLFCADRSGAETSNLRAPAGLDCNKKDIPSDVFLLQHRARDGTRTLEVFSMKPANPNKIKEKRICASGFNRFWTHFGRICVQNCIFNIPSTFKIQIVIK